MLEKVASETTLTGSDLLKETQRRVRWHYQWVAIHDFLPRIVGQEMLDEVFEPETKTIHEPGGKKRKVKVSEPKLRFYHPKNKAFMPVEFSVGAHRFASDDSADLPVQFGDRSSIDLQHDLSPGNTSNLNGFRPLPREWGLKVLLRAWQPGKHAAQKAYRIDQQLVNPLATCRLAWR
jgi:hypothetical protein